MNMVNFYSLGKWWFRKMDRALAKHIHAGEELSKCGVDVKILCAQWALQIKDVTKAAPCKVLNLAFRYIT